MYAQAPVGSTGAAAGMLRTFMYLGAITSASVISLSFGPAATDLGLHHLAAILTVAAAALLVAILTDRHLATARPPASDRTRKAVIMGTWLITGCSTGIGRRRLKAVA